MREIKEKDKNREERIKQADTIDKEKENDRKQGGKGNGKEKINEQRN